MSVLSKRNLAKFLLSLATPLLIHAVCAPATGWAAEIINGPMLGHITDHSARVWLQLSTARQVTITCFDVEHNIQVAGVSTDVQGPIPFVCDMPINNLQPRHTYRIEIRLDGDLTAIPGSDVTIRTPASPGSESTFTIAFSSDLPTKPVASPIFKSIQAAGPQAFLFLGNIGRLPAKLAEFPVTRRASFRYVADAYAEMRRTPALQDLLRTTACYGIWGSRDFGTPEAAADFVFAAEAQAAFQRFWPNPDWGTPDHPGCYCSFTIADADFFLLDDRSFRDPTSPAGADAPLHMLGEFQMKWLQQKLLASHATFKVIAAASPLTINGPVGWGSFPSEQASFFTWLKDRQIPGVFFLSGDGLGRNPPITPQSRTDFGQLTLHNIGDATRKLDFPAYPLVELRAGPLADSSIPATSAAAPASADPSRVGGTVSSPNFGTLDFGGEGEHRFLTLRLRDEEGAVRAEQTIFASQLR